MDNKPIKYTNYDELDQILELFHSEHNGDILDVGLHMLQSWLVVDPSSKFI